MQAGVVHRHRDRRFGVQFPERDDARERVREQNVQYRAQRQRADNTDGHVLLRIARLLGCRGDGVKADEGEEDDACPTQNAAEAEVAELAGVGRDVGVVVPGLDVGPAEEDEQDYDRDFQGDDHSVGAGRLLDADDQQSGHANHHEDRRQVDDAMHLLAPRQLDRRKW